MIHPNKVHTDTSKYLEPYNGPKEEHIVNEPTPTQRIADSLEKMVQLMDYQNKMLTNIFNTLRKGK